MYKNERKQRLDGFLALYKKGACFDSADRPFHSFEPPFEEYLWPFPDLFIVNLRSFHVLRRLYDEQSEFRRYHGWVNSVFFVLWTAYTRSKSEQKFQTLLFSEIIKGLKLKITCSLLTGIAKNLALDLISSWPIVLGNCGSYLYRKRNANLGMLDLFTAANWINAISKHFSAIWHKHQESLFL